ncbi:sigma factor [Dactylosporangium sp. NPDC005572]|uniref:RNA polymerase sigma factor n=1 Tax=Dactylosporangium sp. NPDC005572 TaxID=3156889 RepID=UPI0033A23F4A
MGMPGDDTAAGALVDGDRFTAAWRAALPALRAYCRRAMQHPHDAEDLLQHVALRAWRGSASFRGTSSFQTWVPRRPPSSPPTRPPRAPCGTVAAPAAAAGWS